MSRIARVVVPGYPHHVTQRGNRRQRTFFGDDDYRAYMRLVAKEMPKAGVKIWAYCLMPNHVHFVVVPEHEESLAMLFKEAHRKYTRRVNSREGWCGHLWQERFHSFAMDESHLIAAVRYIELNPVEAEICSSPQDWSWSSVHAHYSGADDLLVTVEPMLRRFPNWARYLEGVESIITKDELSALCRSGRPAGDDKFIGRLERLTGRTLHKRQPGRPKSK